MNELRVDLILDGERRSAGPVSGRFIVRTASAVVVLIVLIALGVGAIHVRALQGRRDRLAEDWATLEPTLKEVQWLQDEAARYEDMVAEFEAWNRTRLPWHDYLADLQRMVPATIQIAGLQANDQVLMVGKSVATVTRLDLRGRAEGKDPKQDVDALLRSLQGGTGLASNVEEAVVESFTIAPGDKDHRLFTIAVRYRPRSFF